MEVIYTKKEFSFAIVIHQLIRTIINNQGYVNGLKKIAVELMPLYIEKKTIIHLSIKDIIKIVDQVNISDFTGNIVASCISTSALAHILCIMSGIYSEIVIGVVLVNGKVFSHAWIELSDGTIICKPFDKYDYKPIKRFTFEGLYKTTI